MPREAAAKARVELEPRECLSFQWVSRLEMEPERPNERRSRSGLACWGAENPIEIVLFLRKSSPLPVGWAVSPCDGAGSGQFAML